jgi:type II secretory pathway component PulJ
MRQSLVAFTLMELMLALFLASLLMVSLLAVYQSTWRRYSLLMNLSHLNLSGRLVRYQLSQKIAQSSSIIASYTKSSLPLSLKRQLKANSDVLLVCKKLNENKQCQQQVAYYVTKTSWRQYGHVTWGLFEKPLDGRRQEMAAHVVGLYVEPLPKTKQWVRFAVLLRSAQPILKQRMCYQVWGHTVRAYDRYLYRVWYGVGVVHEKR